MEKLSIFVVFSIFSAVICNELNVLSSPKSIELKGNNDLPAESISQVFAACLGYSVEGSAQSWDGLYINDPFNTAKSVVTVTVEGVNKLNFPNSKTFNILGDEINFVDDFLSKVMDHSHLASDVNLVDKVDQDVSTAFGAIERVNFDGKVNFLKPKSNKNEEEFVNQIAYLEGLTNLLSETKSQPTALNVHVSLRMISSKNSDSAEKEAIKLLTASIEKLNAVVTKVYGGNAVFAVVSSEESHVRSKRQVGGEDPNAENPYNLAELTSKNYPVVFNIIFWFSVVFIFALIAISLALSNVEDKDSIIYRMTGARGKKEN